MEIENKILIKYPSRERPELFKKVIETWKQRAYDISRIHFLCSFDTDDSSMNNSDMREWVSAEGIEYYYGDNRNKVEAINADIEKTGFDWDTLIVCSDDVEPCIDWDDEIDQHARRDNAVWFYDGRQRRICTIPILGREVFATVLEGSIYDPRFVTAYCDNWHTDLLQRHGLLKFVNRCAFAHRWRVENDDSLMERNNNSELMKADEETYKQLGGNEITYYYAY